MEQQEIKDILYGQDRYNKKLEDNFNISKNINDYLNTKIIKQLNTLIANKLPENDTKFITSLYSWNQEHGMLTKKQTKILKIIYKKYSKSLRKKNQVVSNPNNNNTKECL